MPHLRTRANPRTPRNPRQIPEPAAQDLRAQEDGPQARSWWPAAGQDQPGARPPAIAAAGSPPWDTEWRQPLRGAGSYNQAIPVLTIPIWVYNCNSGLIRSTLHIQGGFQGLRCQARATSCTGMQDRSTAMPQIPFQTPQMPSTRHYEVPHHDSLTREPWCILLPPSVQIYSCPSAIKPQLHANKLYEA